MIQALKVGGAIFAVWLVTTMSTMSAAGQTLRDLLLAYLAYRIVKAIIRSRKRANAGMREYDSQQPSRSETDTDEHNREFDEYDRDFDEYVYGGSRG